MGKVHLNELALKDLSAIWKYVARYNKTTASKLIGDLASLFEKLSQYPGIGKSQDRLLINLHSFPFKDYVVFYQPTDDGVEIIRILHGARDIEKVFEGFFDSL